MNARQELLDRLVAEQHNGGGWRPTNAPPPEPDDEITAARRRRLMGEDFDRLNAYERKAR